MILVAVAYAVIGVGFGLLASSADAHHVRLWRLAAWVASGVVAVAQIGYGALSTGQLAPLNSVACGCAVALGAFGLALAANIHWLVASAHGQGSPLIALVAVASHHRCSGVSRSTGPCGRAGSLVGG